MPDKMTFLKKIFLAHFLLSVCISLHGQIPKNAKQNALQIVNSNKGKFDSISQLLVVFNYKQENYSAVLIALEKRENKWKVKYKPMLAGIGRNGFANFGNKFEGDGKSPTGLFSLGQLFCYEPGLKTKLPFIQTTSEDKWIDDPESADYNKYIRGTTNAKSYENLLLKSNAYKYCMVIEYNTQPVVKGKGSAIFFHLGDEKPCSTAGCVAINENNMRRILKWLKSYQKPSILMGNIEVLKSGL
jgi:L,D-peptidoglycan transpeptidase YkuD (ErfK/YbiS/YcfS/YnhG family)